MAEKFNIMVFVMTAISLKSCKNDWEATIYEIYNIILFNNGQLTDNICINSLQYERELKFS